MKNYATIACFLSEEFHILIMKIAFRVDGNKQLGLGHVKRCMIIAKNLQEKNISCLFITRFKNTQEILQSKNFETMRISPKNESTKIKKILKTYHITTLVVDSKRRSIGKLLKSLHKQTKIVLIDNTRYSKFADLVVIPSVKDPKKHYPPNSIVGIEYVLHGIEKIPKSFSRKNNSILLTMGGSDKFNITKKIIKSFSKSKKDFRLVVILGKYYNDEKNLLKIINHDKRFYVIKNPSSLVRFLTKCSICIATFGITTYESAICRLPLLVISHSYENHLSSKLVEKYGWFSYLGKFDQIKYDLLPNQVLNLLSNKIKLKQMNQACLQIDGLGPSRVTDQLLKI